VNGEYLNPQILAGALVRQSMQLIGHRPVLAEALDKINDPRNLSLAQALMLSSVAFDFRPDVIIDLGTGNGNSAATFGLAARAVGAAVYTFDRVERWQGALDSYLSTIADRFARVTPIVGDLTATDFAPLVNPAARVLVFWDAHGYAIAERILAHLMPLIADKPHHVICHDMQDKRFLPEARRAYGGKRLWRGMTDFYENQDTTAHATIGWTFTIVDQVIPILDFCWRNAIELHSFDGEVRHQIGDGHRSAALRAVGLPTETLFHMGHFSMTETHSRYFPAISR
jgi:hypothetical protein